jgi:hypothetical protein
MPGPAIQSGGIMRLHEHPLPYRILEWIAFVAVVGIEVIIGLVIAIFVVGYLTGILGN